MKEIMNKNEQIKTIKNLITQAKANLKSWTNQISQYHKTLKALSQQLAALRGEIIMNENKLTNPKGGNH